MQFKREEEVVIDLNMTEYAKGGSLWIHDLLTVT